MPTGGPLLYRDKSLFCLFVWINEFFWLLAILDTSLHHRTPDLSYKRLGELRNILAKADSTQKRSGIGSGPNMARYEWLLFEKVEAVEWLQLDFASVRDQFSN